MLVNRQKTAIGHAGGLSFTLNTRFERPQVRRSSKNPEFTKDFFIGQNGVQQLYYTFLNEITIYVEIRL